MNNLTEAETLALEISLFIFLESMENKPKFIEINYRKIDKEVYVSLN